MTPRSHPLHAAQYGSAVLAGAVLGGLTYPLLTLPTRWLLAAIAAFVLLSTCLVFIARLSDFLLTGLFFAIPLAGIAKNYFPDSVSDQEKGEVLYSGTVNVGLVEVLLAGLYVCWFASLLTRRQRPLRVVGLDWLIILLIVAHGLSLLHAPVAILGVLATLHVVKHAFMYLYISRHMRPRHLEWFLAMVAFAIVLQTGLGAVQTATGGQLIGLARDKGAGSGELGSQYEVAAIEHIKRAEGTLTDSHELGLLFAMLLPIPLALAAAREVKPRVRALAALVFVVGLAGLGITFSRSAILGFVVALGVFGAIYVRHSPIRLRFQIALLLVVGGAVILVGGLPVIGYRYSMQSVADALDLRWQQFETALRIWLISPVIGYGAGNYMHGARLYGTDFTELLPVHNISLWIAADTGIIGAIAFHGVLLAALRRYWVLIRRQSGLISILALGLFTGLVACFLDSLTEPLLRAPTVFATFWTLIALSVSLPSMLESSEQVGRRLLRV